MAETEDVQDVTEPRDLEHQIERARDDLAVTIDAIADRVSPKRVASRTVAGAKDAAQNALDRARTAMVAAQQKVADLRASKASHDTESETDRLPNPGMQLFPVERRPQTGTKVAAVVAIGGVVLVVMRRRRRR
ncbi:MAG: hypothetical protein QOI42_596 [Frankiaceae bacterium]|jgi:hypothetical protein|nr:hypothetical protein [Frankiaceae bacterium]